MAMSTVAHELVARQSTTDEVVDYLDNTVLGSVIVLAVILLVALIVLWIWRRFVKRTTVAFTKSAVTRYLANEKKSPRDRELAIERYRARAAAVSGIVASAGAFIIVAIAILFALASIGIDVAPLLASAGIAGIAIGFGAQTIIRDFLSGVFMILENQYGVGDVVTVNGVTGFGGVGALFIVKRPLPIVCARYR